MFLSRLLSRSRESSQNQNQNQNKNSLLVRRRRLHSRGPVAIGIGWRVLSMTSLSVGGSKVTATLTTDSFADEEFAKAVERFILGDRP